MRTRNNVAIGLSWRSRQAVDRKVFDKEVGLLVEIISGDIWDVVDAIKVVPNRDDNEFS